jgi:Flp pilus assembly protein TadG
MHPLPVHFADRLIAFIRRLRDDRCGNVLLMTGAAIPLLLLAVGFGIDYARAQRLQTKLDAAADAAALASVDPTLLSKNSSDVKGYVETMFDQQVKGLNGLTVLSRSATVNDNASGSLGTLRKTTFTYTATSTNIFGSILKMSSLAIGGTSVASASQPPSMNFYIAMDNSPSMLLPTTSTGIANLKASAAWNGEQVLYGQTDGCDFACHATNMQTWNYGVYVIDSNKYQIFTDANSSAFYRVSCSGNVYDQNGNQLGSNASITTTVTGKGSTATYCSGYSPASNSVYIYYLPSGKADKSSNYTAIQVNFPDTFWLVQNYASVNPGSAAIALRTDAERDAAVSVINYAYNLEQQYAATNIPPVYQMQFYTFNAQGTAAALSTAPFGTMTDVANLNGGASFPSATSLVPNIPSSGYYTSFTSMLSTMKGNLPTSAGTGTKASPQSVLIIITDGAVDDNGSISQLTSSNVNQCTAIKNNGTRIAILYTQYLPETINYTAHPTFNSFAKNSLPSIQTQLQACASQNADGTYLMQTVSTNGDVSAALNTLFAMAVQSARLVQ